jgi:hypothetical protein
MAVIAALLLAVAPTRCNGVTDGILCMRLPSGWSSVVSPGHVGGHPAAYLLAGNFRFHRRPNQEARPDVPPHKVLIDIADFPLIGRWAHWRRVERLRLPKTVKRTVSWHVRFAGRALFLSVSFGSKPDARRLALVNARLASVRRVAS